MSAQYDISTCRTLAEKFSLQHLHRPMRVGRYDPGDQLEYDMTFVPGPAAARVRLAVEDFVGGGFAGQVYRVRILDVEPPQAAALEAGTVCAMKILTPPSARGRLFRNMLYRMGFQGPYQPQVNPAAARTGAIWQKFIRLAAAERFGSERLVTDVYATFTDGRMGSCGQLLEWIEGRTWQLEVDDRMDYLRRWRRGRRVDEDALGSAEYRTKHRFMADFVGLLHDIGAVELARQYEWSTCKSQPNCLERLDGPQGPYGRLVAVDFVPGLVLLPFLPMSPGDIRLIAAGIRRGRLVQFDRGDIDRLEVFFRVGSRDFTGILPMLQELRAAEHTYRNSVPDVTHNHVRILYSGTLWSTMLESAAESWRIRGLADGPAARKLAGSTIAAVLFGILGILPVLGSILRRAWGHAGWRAHYGGILTSRDYLARAFRGRVAEKLIMWHRAGRVDAPKALDLAGRPAAFLGQLLLASLPPGLHRFIVDGRFRREKLAYIFARPFRLYFNAELRKQWIRDIVAAGRRKHMLSDEDASTILSRIDEPFIQRYLVSLVVHLLTLPVTQLVSVAVAYAYVRTHPGMTWKETTVSAGAILLAFQVMPVSPGSLVRGLYVLALVIKDRNFKDYSIAVFLSFFKYIGYLAFPIQMTHHYPALARFMAAHWATEAVHAVPVFGESGALLEHWVFSLFYNWPLTIRRRMRQRAAIRAPGPRRYWHAPVCAAAALALLALADRLIPAAGGSGWSGLVRWLPAVPVLAACGAAVTAWCGSLAVWKRIAAAAACGAAVAAFHTFLSPSFGCAAATESTGAVAAALWRLFIFPVLATASAMVTELSLGEE
jgi:hypothetical protein